MGVFIANVLSIPYLDGVLRLSWRPYLYVFFVLFSVKVSVRCIVCDHALNRVCNKTEKYVLVFFGKIITSFILRYWGVPSPMSSAIAC